MRGEVTSEEPISRLGLSLFVILSGSFMGPVLMHSSTLAIPAIALEMQLKANIVSWFTLAQVLASACFVLPAGKLSDRFGRRRMFCLGLLVCCVACLIGGAAFNGYMILIARALQGIGGALIFAAAIALLVSVPPDDQKVRVMGLYISVVYIGMVSGPLFGGILIEHLNWRWVFYLPGIALFVLTFLGLVFIHWERYGDTQSRIRLLDVSLYVGALMLIAFGVFDAGIIKGQLLLALGALSFVTFCWFQSKRCDPLLQVELFTNSRVYTILGFAHFLAYASILALPFTLTLYLQFIKGIDAQSTGLILLTQALCTAAVAPTAGWLSVRVRSRYLIFSGIIMFVTACVILASIKVTTPVWLIVLALALIGVGVGIMDAPIVHASMSTVTEELLGSASATLNGLRTLGGLLGMSIISYLMGVHLNNAPVEPAVYPQLMVVVEQFFIASLGLAILCLALLVYGVLTRQRPQSSVN